MKKILAILLILILTAALTACGNETVEEPVVPATDSDDGILSVAVSPDYAPMEFVDVSKSDRDKFVGFDIMLAQYLADEMGMVLEIRPMSFDACQEAVKNGQVDMSISGYSFTRDRADEFFLSDYYYAGENGNVQTFLTKAEKAHSFKTIKDFDGFTIGAQRASLQLELCVDNLSEAVEIKEFEDNAKAVEALMNGELDALAVSAGNGKTVINKHSELAFTDFRFELLEDLKDNVILIKKGDTGLLAKVNEILAKANAEGRYVEWYEEAQRLAQSDTAQDVSYDAEGNEEEKN